MAGIKEQLQGQMRRDGIDHLNISAMAETDLGKIVSPDWRKKFYVPHMGDFINARAFANWMVSGGDEDLRHNTGFYKTSVPVEDFRKLLVFAKYYQMCSMRTSICNSKDLFDLPWVMYKRHVSGVREFDRWQNYTSIIKPMVEDVANNPGGRFDWVNLQPDILDCVNDYLERITGEDFVAFERLDEITRKAAADRVKGQAAEESVETAEQEEAQASV